MMRTGRCLCGAIAFSCNSRSQFAHECHCQQCPRWSGHVWAYVTMRWTALTFQRDDGLRWHRQTKKAERGFCVTCGTSMFWRPEGLGRVDVSAAVLDQPTGLRLGAVSFPEFQGDYCAPGWVR